MKSLKTTLNEAVVLPPTRMSNEEVLEVFNSAKKGKEVELWYDSSIGKGSNWKTYIVGTKSTSKKYKHTKLALLPEGTPRKDFLYNREGKVSFALGDMGATLIAIRPKQYL